MIMLFGGLLTAVYFISSGCGVRLLLSCCVRPERSSEVEKRLHTFFIIINKFSWEPASLHFFFIMKKVLLFAISTIAIFMTVSCKNNSNNKESEAGPGQNEQAQNEVREPEAGPGQNEQAQNEVREPEVNYIMIPGVTYVTTQSGADTDIMGGKVSLSMEFTIYKDGTAIGNIIETNSDDYYGNENSCSHPVEGAWEEVSKHDKRFVKIFLVLRDDDQNYLRGFTYYVDEDLKAYSESPTNKPIQLKQK